MKNLLEDYASEVSEDSWHQLVEALSSQSEGIVALIEQEKGPVRKTKAQDAVASLTEALRKRGLEIDALASATVVKILDYLNIPSTPPPVAPAARDPSLQTNLLQDDIDPGRVPEEPRHAAHSTSRVAASRAAASRAPP